MLPVYDHWKSNFQFNLTLFTVQCQEKLQGTATATTSPWTNSPSQTCHLFRPGLSSTSESGHSFGDSQGRNLQQDQTDSLPPRSLLTTLVTLAWGMAESSVLSLCILSGRYDDGIEELLKIFLSPVQQYPYQKVSTHTGNRFPLLRHLRLTYSYSPWLPGTPPGLEILPPEQPMLQPAWPAGTRLMVGALHGST